MKDTIAYSKTILECGVCGQRLLRCAGCKRYLYGGQPIRCFDDEHFCRNCGMGEDDDIIDEEMTDDEDEEEWS